MLLTAAFLTACASTPPTSEPKVAATPAPSVAAPEAEPAGFVQVATGMDYTCALRANGEIQCWGRNEWGRMVAPPGEYASVAAGADHACGVKTDGTIACWGYAGHNADVPATGGWTAVAVGIANTCALDADGKISCWGPERPERNAPEGAGYVAIALGNGDFACALNAAGEISCWGEDENGQTSPPAGGGFRSLSVGNDVACVLDAAGAPVCWGDDAPSLPAGEYTAIAVGNFDVVCGAGLEGIVCTENDRERHLPPPEGARSWVGIDSSTHFCAVSADGEVGCWGDADSGQARVPEGRPYLDMFTWGPDETCVLREPHEFICFGTRRLEAPDSWMPPKSLEGSRQIVGAGGYACMLDAEGVTNCWGEFQHPIEVPASERFTRLFAGPARLCGLREDGTSRCFGWLGHTGDEHPPTDEALRSLSLDNGRLCWLGSGGGLRCYNGHQADGDFVEVAASFDTTCVLDADGAAQCVGDEVAVPKSPGLHDMVAGNRHFCALNAANHAVCWGDDQNGQTRAPADVEFRLLRAGSSSTCGIRIDGGIHCWGERAGEREIMSLRLDP